MALTIDKVVGGGVDIPNGGDTPAARVFVYGKALFPDQPLIFHNDREPEVRITADNQGDWNHAVATPQQQSYTFYVTTRDGQNASNRWQVNKV
ncbi:hypothetical protein [Pseudomonas extremorientalis]|jgi:hypothetical protein|uniref:Uncharacterized protein n=1 Tax=Pseudomonas extremorientalis TaxID=169669 RepID=A0A1H0Q9X0_9PSED|nr:hypothetical protein [Pseudomonas extremorientalis]KAB0517187.1 hypothetical protein F7R08_18730 [Pseudomonas extremorientalis]OIN10687.1 hypothetical protein BFN10_08310 [Pseudomonas extremorientalis]UUN87793.1 hypothetical protein LUU92_23545 [Pseudomonas extremorientalis]WLG55873.1 hypothetical protein PSH77_24930 [Pseudomonas extremorientalis]SDP13980.1 hypothetical protein SAMN04490184_2406 [Pseudomonas extremorientalis]